MIRCIKQGDEIVYKYLGTAHTPNDSIFQSPQTAAFEPSTTERFTVDVLPQAGERLKDKDAYAAAVKALGELAPLDYSEYMTVKFFTVGDVILGVDAYPPTRGGSTPRCYIVEMLARAVAYYHSQQILMDHGFLAKWDNVPVAYARFLDCRSKSNASRSLALTEGQCSSVTDQNMTQILKIVETEHREASGQPVKMQPVEYSRVNVPTDVPSVMLARDQGEEDSNTQEEAVGIVAATRLFVRLQWNDAHQIRYQDLYWLLAAVYGLLAPASKDATVNIRPIQPPNNPLVFVVVVPDSTRLTVPPLYKNEQVFMAMSKIAKDAGAAPGRFAEVTAILNWVDGARLINLGGISIFMSPSTVAA